MRVAKRCSGSDEHASCAEAGVAKLSTEVFKSSNEDEGKQKPVRILAWSGSLRRASTNTGLLRAAAAHVKKGAAAVELEVVDITPLPMLNTDLEGRSGGVPAVVREFQRKVQAADAILLAVPEYNYGVSAPLKNALDWASRKDAGTGQPWTAGGKVAALLSAGGGLGGARAQYAVRQTAVFLDLRMVNKPEVMVRAFDKHPDTGAFLNFDLATGDVVSEAVRGRVGELVDALVAAARRR